MINEKAALDVTENMLCSVIDYGNIFLSSIGDNELDDLQILQIMQSGVVIVYLILEINMY